MDSTQLSENYYSAVAYKIKQLKPDWDGRNHEQYFSLCDNGDGVFISSWDEQLGPKVTDDELKTFNVDEVTKSLTECNSTMGLKIAIINEPIVKDATKDYIDIKKITNVSWCSLEDGILVMEPGRYLFNVQKLQGKTQLFKNDVQLCEDDFLVCMFYISEKSNFKLKGVGSHIVGTITKVA